ncbi:AI-2E family transporter [Methylocella silvestris]|uniref:AI-2E family transporter n=1 Tax=Methylocella silvestris TaxID=199596 RepID=A0A2J7TJ84_METSI|nr:AI-2E family transporter [Methylocella silvestris]PNG26831.1 AI-2E family transporter [Methylocella silvestris]
MRLEWQIGFWLGALVLFVLLLWLFSGVLLPFAAALALGYLLNPVADRLERLGLNRLGATLLIMAGFILILALILVLVMPAFWRQLSSFLQALPDYAVRLEDLAADFGARFAQDHGGSILEKLGFGKETSTDLRNSTSDLVNQAAQWAGAFVKSIWSSGAALISVVSLLVLTPVVAFYMLLDWDKMIATVDSLVPLRHRGTVRELAREIDAALAGFLRGQSLVCLFLGLWYGVGLSLIGLNFGLLIGITAGFLSFIPYVGSLTALVLSAVIAIVQGWPEWRLTIMAIGVVVSGQFLEGNILSPKLVGGSVGLHPVWLIFALLAFGSLFGFTGLIIAVPCAAAFGVILRFAVRRYRSSKLYTELEGPGSKILIEAPGGSFKETS